MAPTVPLLCSLILPLADGEGGLQPAVRRRNSRHEIILIEYEFPHTILQGYYSAVASSTVVRSYIDGVLYIIEHY